MRTLYVRCPDRGAPDGGCRRRHELHVVAGMFRGEPIGRRPLLGRMLAHWTRGARDLGELRERSVVP
jgi:hypothetical protein